MNPHRFVWHDFNTHDLDGAKRFYGEVFQWNLDKGDREYAHITAGDQMIGGMRAMTADERQPASWLGYVLVDDVAATVAKIEAQHGRVYMPTTVMDKVGTFAVTADPTGAVFAPWRSARAEDNEPDATFKPALGIFCWDELVTTDPAAAGSFYASVLGWEPHAVDMGGGTMYTLLHRPGTKGPDGQPLGAGGMMKSPPGLQHSFWIAYVSVDSADRASDHAKQLGATIAMPPTDIPNVGRFACWMDPQGASIAVLAPAR